MEERLRGKKDDDVEKSDKGRLNLIRFWLECYKDDPDKFPSTAEKNWSSPVEGVYVYLRPNQSGQGSFAMKSLVELHHHSCQAKNHILRIAASRCVMGDSQKFNLSKGELPNQVFYKIPG